MMNNYWSLFGLAKPFLITLYYVVLLVSKIIMYCPIDKQLCPKQVQRVLFFHIEKRQYPFFNQKAKLILSRAKSASLHSHITRKPAKKHFLKVSNQIHRENTKQKWHNIFYKNAWHCVGWRGRYNISFTLCHSIVELSMYREKWRH